MDVEKESIRKSEFDVIYAANSEGVLQMAMLHTRNLHIAEDIMQEVFLRYYIYTEHNQVESARGWLLKATRNMASNYRRDHRREILVDIGETEIRMFGFDKSAESLFFKKMWKRESLYTTGTILGALYKKNIKWYRAVTLVYCMEYSYKEAAECLEITENALDGILRRAKKWIQENYAEEYNQIIKA